MRQILTRFYWKPSLNFAILCLLANIFALPIVLCQDSCTGGPCYPPPADISGDFNVTANSTCGDPPEQYCVKLNCTKVCDAKDPNNNHNPSFVNDPFGWGKFWKSKNFQYPVALQLDFGRTFMLYRSVVTFYHELPAAMYLLKSNDSGRTFDPIAYFATNCKEAFNMSETPENERKSLKVQCFGIDPATNPNLQVSLMIYIFTCKKAKWSCCRIHRSFPHSNKQWLRIDVRVGCYENSDPVKQETVHISSSTHIKWQQRWVILIRHYTSCFSSHYYTASNTGPSYLLSIFNTTLILRRQCGFNRISEVWENIFNTKVSKSSKRRWGIVETSLSSNCVS